MLIIVVVMVWWWLLLLIMVDGDGNVMMKRMVMNIMRTWINKMK